MLNKKGFTIIEMLVVLAILGIIAMFIGNVLSHTSFGESEHFTVTVTDKYTEIEDDFTSYYIKAEGIEYGARRAIYHQMIVGKTYRVECKSFLGLGGNTIHNATLKE